MLADTFFIEPGRNAGLFLYAKKWLIKNYSC
nr:MAG TPA: hypothetical protein [Caudoviricetes sp.]